MRVDRGIFQKAGHAHVYVVLVNILQYSIYNETLTSFH